MQRRLSTKPMSIWWNSSFVRSSSGISNAGIGELSNVRDVGARVVPRSPSSDSNVVFRCVDSNLEIRPSLSTRLFCLPAEIGGDGTGIGEGARHGYLFVLWREGKGKLHQRGL